MLRRILSRQQEDLAAAEKGILGELAAVLERFGASAEDRSALSGSIRQLDELFLLVVLGEFNAGKSAFINALLGRKLLAEGVTPTTSRIQVLTHGEAVSHTPEGPGLDRLTAPVPLLAELAIVDTPGTNAIHREHEALTRDFVPRSDLVLFVTSADHPFTESERSFLTEIRDWGKKVLFVINKADILTAEEDRERVRSFVVDNAVRLLSAADPPVFLVSARRAREAREAGAGGGDDGGFSALETYITETLDEAGRVSLKLANPLGVGSRLVERYLTMAEERLTLLAADVAVLDDVETQLAAWREDMDREFRFRLSDVDNVLHAFERRGVEFFDETVRLARIFDLLQRSKLKADFERQVVGDLPRRIDEKVAEVIDWMVSSDVKQWRAVTDHLERRRQVHAERIVGTMGAGFEGDRERLLMSVGREARSAVDSYDERVEASRMAESVQNAVAGTALVEVGAVGLGTAVAFLATSTFADVTGLLAAGTVALLGFFVLPARRREAKRELTEKIDTLRRRLMDSLTRGFERELAASEGRIRESIAPYTRFVRTERTALAEHREELLRLRGELARIRERIEASTHPAAAGP